MYRQRHRDQGTSQLAMGWLVLTDRGCANGVRKCEYGWLGVLQFAVIILCLYQKCLQFMAWLQSEYLNIYLCLHVCTHPVSWCFLVPPSSVFWYSEDSCAFRLPSCSHVHLTETIVSQLTVLQIFSLFSLLSYSFSLSPSTAAFHLSSCIQPNYNLLKSPRSICDQLSFNLDLLQSCCISAPRGNHSCGTPVVTPICFNLFLCLSLRRGDCTVIFLPSFAGRLRMQSQAAAAKPI